MKIAYENILPVLIDNWKNLYHLFAFKNTKAQHQCCGQEVFKIALKISAQFAGVWNS